MTAASDRPPPDVPQVLLAWQAASHFAWGLVGLNIALALSEGGRLRPLMARLDPADLWIDPLRLRRLQPAMRASAELAPRLAAASAAQPLRFDGAVVHCLMNDAVIAQPQLRGARNIGRIVFENTHFGADGIDRLRAMDALTVISNWNAGIVRALADVPVAVNHEGVDPGLFFPGPRSGLMDPSRFYVFSGGKAEFRKGQDLILAAFRVFAARCPEAVLVTAWQNPWPQGAVGLRGVLKAPLQGDGQGRLAIVRWAADNGIDPGRVIDLGPVPNALMPLVLREMDCAVCASRAEGGTNLPVMEAMACGVPSIVADNTGLRDLIEDDNALVLRRQAPIRGAPGRGTDGWGDSSVDELVEALSAMYESTELRQTLGAAGARSMRARTWRAHAERLADLVKGV